jgi:hypothetical protein
VSVAKPPLDVSCFLTSCVSINIFEHSAYRCHYHF